MMRRVVRLAVIAALTWGALAFGAVYPWAYTPLALLCVVSGSAAVVVCRGAGLPSRPLLAAVLLVVIAITLQLVPLSQGSLGAISPATPELLRTLNVAFAAGVQTTHPLSISPAFSTLGLLLVVSFAVFFVGLTGVLSRWGPRWLAGGVVALGALMALVGIVQKPSFAGEIYGFWRPIADDPRPFGPFVNKNHFAGWMLMALPLVLALLASNLERGLRGIRTARERVLWFGTTTGSLQLMMMLAALIMGLSLVLTMSRSGMAAGVLGAVIAGIFVARGTGSTTRKALTLGCLVVLPVVVVFWAGTDLVAGRFQDADWETFDARRGAWADAWRIATLFPLTGTGFNTYGVANTIYQTHHLQVHFAQAHNDYLQLAAEGGVLVGAPIVLAIGIFARDVRRRFAQEPSGTTTWWLRAGSVVGLVAIAAQEIVEFSLQMPGNAALFAALCAIAVHSRSQETH